MYPQTHWNYRVLAFKDKSGIIELKICEVHYELDNPVGYAEASYISTEDGIKELEWSLNKMKESLSKPILWGDEQFPQEYVVA